MTYSDGRTVGGNDVYLGSWRESCPELYGGGNPSKSSDKVERPLEMRMRTLLGWILIA